MSAQYNQEILFDLKWQNSTNAGGGCKEDSSLLFKKYFCNIYLMLEMNGGENELLLNTLPVW